MRVASSRARLAAFDRRMSAWVLPEHSEGASPYVVEDSVENAPYIVGILQVGSLAHQPRFHIVLIAAFDSNKILAAGPKSAWNRKQNQRIIPMGWFTKMTSLEVIACASGSFGGETMERFSEERSLARGGFFQPARSQGGVQLIEADCQDAILLLVRL